MRTHENIIRETGASTVLARLGLPVSLHTVRSWMQRDAIPGEYWTTFERVHIAPVSELAAAAAARKNIAHP